MKLNNVIILTIVDFRRHFTFPAFWKSRKSFIRDMKMDKLSSYSDDDRIDYEIISKWIVSEDNNTITVDQRQNGLSALSRFARCTITEDDLIKTMGMRNLAADIILVPVNEVLKLPGIYKTGEEAMTYAKDICCRERLHKIEVDGDDFGNAIVFIGEKEVARLKGGECAYVTEVGGQFLRIMPNYIKESGYTLTLRNIPGSFESDVVEEFKSIAGPLKEIKKNVTQFEIKSGRPIYYNDRYFTLNK